MTIKTTREKFSRSIWSIRNSISYTHRLTVRYNKRSISV